ncbi:MAG: BLUF domain-containing protein [Bacteroidota bacterium]
MSGLSRIVYTSRKSDSCTNQEIEKILESCRKNNSKDHITGILLHSDDKFIQYLEGDPDTIKSLYDTIKGDERHYDVFLIFFEPIEKRLFPTWHMGYKNVYTKSLDFNTEIEQQDLQVFRKLIEGNKLNSDLCVKTLKKFFETSVL